MRVRPAPGAVSANVDGSLVVLNPRTSEFVELNAVAAAIWDTMGEGPTEASVITAAVLASFDVDPAVGTASVANFLDQAIEAGLIEQA